MVAIGSSPLARGLLIGGDLQNAKRGIIPARAGFTMSDYGTQSGQKDHPRSRGVYMAKAWQMPWKVGSSPLARGLLLFLRL